MRHLCKVESKEQQTGDLCSALHPKVNGVRLGTQTTVVGGNPAKVIKKRFTDETIAILEELAWWNWSVEKITQNITAIMSSDIEALRN